MPDSRQTALERLSTLTGSIRLTGQEQEDLRMLLAVFDTAANFVHFHSGQSFGPSWPLLISAVRALEERE